MLPLIGAYVARLAVPLGRLDDYNLHYELFDHEHADPLGRRALYLRLDSLSWQMVTMNAAVGDSSVRLVPETCGHEIFWVS